MKINIINGSEVSRLSVAIQNDLFRLTYALELATQHDWVYQVLNDTQWSGRRQAKLNPGVNSIFVLKSALESGFCNDGNQLRPVPARIGGQTEGLNALLRSCGWEAVSNDKEWHLIVRNFG
ncbi:hypothetical protein ACOQH0_23380 (plasmid) [Enterobacter sp. JS8-1]|uniref:hypothetical protein n=1 Tax=Enterobacter sp. JS8-1 TaxID=3411633 RepID=UPI003BA39ADC